MSVLFFQQIVAVESGHTGLKMELTRLPSTLALALALAFLSTAYRSDAASESIIGEYYEHATIASVLFW